MDLDKLVKDCCALTRRHFIQHLRDPDRKDSENPFMAGHSRREHLKFFRVSTANDHCCVNECVAMLHHASRAGSVKLVQRLMNKGASLDLKNFHGETPLMVAAKRSNIEVAELLINSGADVNCCDNKGKTVLHHAAHSGAVKIVQCLVNKGAALDMKNSDGKTPLIVATETYHREVFELLIISGADIHCCDKRLWTVLHHASHNGFVEFVQYLVNKGADLDMRNFLEETPLMVATKSTLSKVAELLINSGADIHCCNKHGWTVLHQASCKGLVKIVQCLLNKGAILDIKDSIGQTPFIVAARRSKIEVVELLLNSGADIHCCDKRGWTALHPASHEGVMPNVETIKLCIEKGAYVSATDYCKLLENPLHKEAILQDVKLCSKALINKFNYRDLPLLYEGIAFASKLPRINKMQIRDGSGMAVEVEKAVTHKIQTKGFCNLVKIIPSVLSMLCVKSLMEKSNLVSNRAFPSESQNSLTLGYNQEKYPCKRICLKKL